MDSAGALLGFFSFGKIACIVRSSTVSRLPDRGVTGNAADRSALVSPALDFYWRLKPRRKAGGYAKRVSTGESVVGGS